MKPTPEQRKAVSAFKSGHDITLIAYAGAGKTSTLKLMAKANKAPSLYLAFNKRIAEEARTKFPYHVDCRTAHSLAFRSMRYKYSIEQLTTSPYLLDSKLPDLLDPTIREITAQTLRRFMQGSLPQVSEMHVPDLIRLGYPNSQFLHSKALDNATSVWEMMYDGKLNLGHDGYLKAWALSRPDLNADVVYVDEAQDLNPVLTGLLKNITCQRVCVGDRHQQIYEWRGAIDALNYLKGRRRYLTQSFRFGEQIAATSNVILSHLGEERPLIGSGPEGFVHQYDQDEETPTTDAILCRSNSGVISSIIQNLGHRKVFVPGSVRELISLVNDAQRLECNQPVTTGELMAFKSWSEVIKFSESTEGQHLKVFVKLVNDWGTQSLLSTLHQVSANPTPGCVTISTAHKGKGLEWPSVTIAPDFFVGKDVDKLPAAAFRLLYVAMTRAQNELYIPAGLLDQYKKIERVPY